MFACINNAGAQKQSPLQLLKDFCKVFLEETINASAPLP